MKTRFTRFLAAALVLTLVMSLGGFAESGLAESAAGEKTKLVLVQYLGNDDRDKLIQEIAAQIPGIELEIISPPTETATQKIMTMMQAGEQIDLVEVGQVNQDYINNGFILPLDKYVAEWDEWSTVTENLKTLSQSQDEQTWLIPYGVYERALFYRKDWFEEAGIAVPTTWDELYEAAKQLTDPSLNRYGYSFRGGAGTGGFAEMTIMSFIDPAKISIGCMPMTTDGKSMFEQEGALEAVEFYKKLYTDCAPADAIGWGYNEMVEAFYSGVTAMVIQDAEVIATCEQYMEEGTWATAPLPVGPHGTASFPGGFAGWSIGSSSVNPDKAWELLKTMSSAENNTYFCKQNGNIPIHTTAQEDPFFAEGAYSCYITMHQQPDKYIPYIDFGCNNYAPYEDQEKAKVYGDTLRDAGMQEVLMGSKDAQTWLDECAAAYSHMAGADWIR